MAGNGRRLSDAGIFNVLLPTKAQKPVNEQMLSICTLAPVAENRLLVAANLELELITFKNKNDARK